MWDTYESLYFFSYTVCDSANTPSSQNFQPFEQAIGHHNHAITDKHSGSTFLIKGKMDHLIYKKKKFYFLMNQ